MKRDFVATCYAIEDARVLLIFHKKLRKWLPPGGHLDPNELPHEAAIREMEEETGLMVELISDDIITFSYENSRSIPRPFMTALEEIPAYKEIPAHQHIDFIYLGRPIGGTQIQNIEETDAIHWFSECEVLALPESDIFTDTRETISHILRKICPAMQCS